MKVKRFCQPPLVKRVELKLTRQQYDYLDNLSRSYNIKIPQMLRIIIQDVIDKESISL